MKSQPKLTLISAKKTKKLTERICQGDIFTDIEIIERIDVKSSKVIIEKIIFPYVVCLNQECDLDSDYKACSGGANKDCRLIHIAVAPAFIFDQFLTGKHWGEIFIQSHTGRRTDTKYDLIIKNEIPRFHYLKFPENDMPELIIDFKHFFTISRSKLYESIGQRLCSLDDLFKEKISQRFSNFISRIGLPEENSEEKS